MLLLGFVAGSIFVLYEPLSFNTLGVFSILLLILGIWIGKNHRIQKWLRFSRSVK